MNPTYRDSRGGWIISGDERQRMEVGRSHLAMAEEWIEPKTLLCGA